jgi:hypothetical protein
MTGMVEHTAVVKDYLLDIRYIINSSIKDTMTQN